MFPNVSARSHNLRNRENLISPHAFTTASLKINYLITERKFRQIQILRSTWKCAHVSEIITCTNLIFPSTRLVLCRLRHYYSGKTPVDSSVKRYHKLCMRFWNFHEAIGETAFPCKSAYHKSIPNGKLHFKNLHNTFERMEWKLRRGRMLLSNLRNAALIASVACQTVEVHSSICRTTTEVHYPMQIGYAPQTRYQHIEVLKKGRNIVFI